MDLIDMFQIYIQKHYRLLKKKILISLNLILVNFLVIMELNGRGIMYHNMLEKNIGQVKIDYHNKD